MFALVCPRCTHVYLPRQSAELGISGKPVSEAKCFNVFPPSSGVPSDVCRSDTIKRDEKTLIINVDIMLNVSEIQNTEALWSSNRTYVWGSGEGTTMVYLI